MHTFFYLILSLVLNQLCYLFCCSDTHENIINRTQWTVTTNSNNGCTKTMIFKQKSADKEDCVEDKDNSTQSDSLIMVFNTLKENFLFHSFRSFINI